MALLAKLNTPHAAAAEGDDVALEVANLQNDIADLQFEILQVVPHKLWGGGWLLQSSQDPQFARIQPGKAPWASVLSDLWTVDSSSAG